MTKNNNSHEVVLGHESANAIITKLSSGKFKISIHKQDPHYFVRWETCETSYPIELIRQIFEVKGPGWLCDEIARDESPEYSGAALKWQLLSYVHEDKFDNARILDFGCGSGASSCSMSRLFPSANIIGVELEESLLSIAKARVNYYGYENIDLIHSPNPESVPSDLGKFDYIIMTGVYEHLLPKERKNLLPQLWLLLKPEGILFLHETPNRHFPIETHTTGGLPLINYMPKSFALPYARKISKRNLVNDSWEILLRKGLRGGSRTEIINILNNSEYKPILMEPSRRGVKNRIDLWYLSSEKSRHRSVKNILRVLMVFIRFLTSVELVPYLELAIRKNPITQK